MNAPREPGFDSHEITFTLLERDAWALLQALDDTLPSAHPAPARFATMASIAKWSAVAVPIALLSLIFLLLLSTHAPIRMWQVVLVAFLCLVFGASFVWMLPERKLPPFTRACLGLGYQRTIVLSRDGVRASAGGMSSFVPWGAYSGVGLSNGYVLLYRGGVADFLPVSAFSTEEEADEVARKVARHISAARPHHDERKPACV